MKIVANDCDQYEWLLCLITGKGIEICDRWPTSVCLKLSNLTSLT